MLVNNLNEQLLLVFIIFVIAGGIFTILLYRKQGEVTLNSKYLFKMLALAYGSILVVAIAMPQVFSSSASNFYWQMQFNFTPFSTIGKLINQGNFILLLAKIVLFVPLPIFLSKLFGWQNFGLKTAIICLAVCLGAEVIQIGVNFITNYPNKIIDIDDVLLYFSGCCLGLLVQQIIGYRIRRVRY